MKTIQIYTYPKQTLSHLRQSIQEGHKFKRIAYFLVQTLIPAARHQSFVLDSIEYSFSFGEYQLLDAQADPQPARIETFQISDSNLNIILELWNTKQARNCLTLPRLIRKLSCQHQS